MKDKIELMSPAGNWQALEAAVNAGADAVYLGGSRFGARQYAQNFDREELSRAVEFAHLRRVKIYVTVNILAADSEMHEVAGYLAFLSDAGVDAVIVQDLGVATVARQVAPQLPLFASTQMTLTNAAGVAFAESAGFSRSVLARETNLDELSSICQKAASEIEVFIHGALCMCYSGQCLMSSLIGGRSGNRGQCAQPCRLPYALVDAGGSQVTENNSVGQYILSPKDLNTIELLPQIIEAGAASFKIEGRMKRPEYVAVVTSIYRRAIDSFLAGDFHLPDNTLRDLKQIFNRDFTTAYLSDRPGRAILSDRRPNNRGLQIGRVVAYDQSSQLIAIKLEEDLHIDDGIEIWVSVGGRGSATVKELFLDGQAVLAAPAGRTVQIRFPYGVSLNDRVFRTFDSELMEYAQSFFGIENKRFIPVQAEVQAYTGQPLKIVFTDEDGNRGEGETEFFTEAARKHPLTEESIKKQVERLGNTDFCLAALSVKLDDNVMVPVSEINEARRKAIEQLKAARLRAFLPAREKSRGVLPALAKGNDKYSGKTLLSVHVDSLDKAAAVLEAGADVLLFGGETYNHMSLGEKDYREAAAMARAAGRQVYFATPRIVREEESAAMGEHLASLAGCKPGGVLVGNLGVWQQAQGQGMFLWPDYSLNVFNSWTLDFWRDRGAAGATLSPELTFPQIERLRKKDILPLECLVHGRTEMMVSEYCAPGSLLGNAVCQDGRYFLEDRKKERFPLVTDQFCRMHILNAKELCLLDSVDRFRDMGMARIRIDARYMDAKEAAMLTADYRAALDGRSVSSAKYENITRGHYFRGVV